MVMPVAFTGHTAQARSLTQYRADLARSGVRVEPGASGTFWAQHEALSFSRQPVFELAPPTPEEVRHVLWKGRAAVASYLQEPDARHPANAWLYLCADQTYALEKLAPPARRAVRRGMRELRVAPLTADELLAHGAQAYCETRRRVGLSDGTREQFLQRFAHYSALPEVMILGAWRDGQLAAFLSGTEVDDWAEIGIFSADALLQYRPNDTLVFCALYHYLVERHFRVVSYGLSSIQAHSNAAGLHRFKLKLGFQASPVHRAFVPHPLVRPFANRATLWGVNTMLRFRPADRRLRKAGGALASLLGETHTLEAVLEPSTEE